MAKDRLNSEKMFKSLIDDKIEHIKAEILKENSTLGESIENLGACIENDLPKL